MRGGLPGQRGLTALLLAAILALTAWVYLPGLSGGFLFDDSVNIVNNPFLRSSAFDLDAIHKAIQSGAAGTLKRPISMVSFSANYHFWGSEPYSFKAVNLGIHLLTGIALFILTLLLFKSQSRNGQIALRQAAIPLAALGITLLWLVHPLNLTGVLYIVQRMASLSALFTVIGLCIYLWARLRTINDSGGYLWIFIGVPLATLFAIFSKENGALLPLFAVVLEIGLFRFRDASGRMDKRIVTFFTVTVAFPALIVITKVIISPDLILSPYEGRQFDLEQRLLTQGRVLIFYLKMLTLPQLHELGLYHDDFINSSGILSPASTLGAWLALAAMLVTGVWALFRAPLIGIGILWFFVAHLMESTVIALEMIHEHRNYLASYGPILALMAALLSMVRSRPGALLLAAAVLLAAGGLTLVTHERATQWSDLFLQSSYEARHHPASARANYVAGHRYGVQALNGDKAAADMAFHYLELARQADEKSVMANMGLITLSYGLQRPLRPEWIAEAERRLATQPFHAGSVTALLLISKCQSRGECRLPAQTVSGFFRAALRNPSFAPGATLTKNHGKILATYGAYLLNQRDRLNESEQLFLRAIAIDPSQAEYRWMLATALLGTDKLEAAAEQLRQTRELDSAHMYDSQLKRLERILAEKTKQAPRRAHPPPSYSDSVGSDTRRLPENSDGSEGKTD